MSLFKNEINIDPEKFAKVLKDKEIETLFQVLRLAKKMGGMEEWRINQIGEYFDFPNIYNLL